MKSTNDPIDSRLLEILDAHMNPRLPNGISEATEAAVDALLEGAQSSENIGAPGSSLNFMAESELDNDTVSFENGAEWVEKEEVPQTSEQTTLIVEVETTVAPSNVSEPMTHSTVELKP